RSRRCSGRNSVGLSWSACSAIDCFEKCSASRASWHPSSPRQARAGVSLPSWEETAIEYRPALADRTAGSHSSTCCAKALRFPRFILHACLHLPELQHRLDRTGKTVSLVAVGHMRRVLLDVVGGISHRKRDAAFGKHRQVVLHIADRRNRPARHSPP